MADGLGTYLRELRARRQVSLGPLAGRARVAKSTLSRWEAGAAQPRVPELEAVLAALGVSEEERARALALVAAPRAVRHLREVAASGVVAEEELGSLPSAGDLLRAMRRRRGLSQEEVAAQLRVHLSTVSSWERSRTFPADPELEALLRLLQADPDEQALLARRQHFLAPTGVTAPGLDELELRLREAWGETERGRRAGIDLCLLSLEAALWPRAGQEAQARLLLVNTWTCYAQWLMWRQRPCEARAYARRVLAAARGAPGGATSLLPALAKALNVVTRLGTRPSRPASYARAFELLASWLPYGSGPDWETFLYREMGVHAADAGNPEAAMDLAERALEVADRAQDPAAVRVARRVKAGVLISVGQFEAAAAFLPRELAVVPARRLLEMLHWSQCLLGMGERSAAVRYLNGGYDLAAAYDYPRAGLDVVTQEFDRR